MRGPFVLVHACSYLYVLVSVSCFGQTFIYVELPCYLRSAESDAQIYYSLSLFGKSTESRRNSELIINKNNILLKVIDTTFSTSQFTMVLNFFLHCFTFCVQCLLGGHHPSQCTGAHELKEAAHNGLKCFF